MKYRFDGKFEKELPLDWLAFEEAGGYHDDRSADVEKQIDGVWYEAIPTHNGCVWSDGINMITTEAHTEFEAAIVTIYTQIESGEDIIARNKAGDLHSQAQAALKVLKAKLETLFAEREAAIKETNYEVGFDITAANQDKVIDILKHITHEMQLEAPLFIMGGKLCFRGGPFLKVDAVTAMYATREFHILAKQNKLA